MTPSWQEKLAPGTPHGPVPLAETKSCADAISETLIKTGPRASEAVFDPNAYAVEDGSEPSPEETKRRTRESKKLLRRAYREAKQENRRKRAGRRYFDNFLPLPLLFWAATVALCWTTGLVLAVTFLPAIFGSDGLAIPAWVFVGLSLVFMVGLTGSSCGYVLDHNAPRSQPASSALFGERFNLFLVGLKYWACFFCGPAAGFLAAFMLWFLSGPLGWLDQAILLYAVSLSLGWWVAGCACVHLERRFSGMIPAVIWSRLRPLSFLGYVKTLGLVLLMGGHVLWGLTALVEFSEAPVASFFMVLLLTTSGQVCLLFLVRLLAKNATGQAMGRIGVAPERLPEAAPKSEWEAKPISPEAP